MLLPWRATPSRATFPGVPDGMERSSFLSQSRSAEISLYSAQSEGRAISRENNESVARSVVLVSSESLQVGSTGTIPRAVSGRNATDG